VIEPTWQSGDVTLYHADCLDVLPILADSNVDALVTDPMYGVNLNYGKAFDDSEDYWLQTVPKVLEWIDNRLCIMFGASPTMQRDMSAFPRPCQRVLIWSPAFSLSKSRAQGMFYRWHPIYCWNLPQKHEGPSLDILRISCDGHNWWYHPGTKPEELMRILVQIATKEATVLDPFMGSGTTGVACVQTGRKFVGIEIDRSYFEIAVKRIEQAQMQQRLPMGEKVQA